jgi:(p)ppGpp synthase/HD superfamily hydrolase
MTQKLLPNVYLTERFFDAMSYASFWHKDDVRKSTNITYICHPLSVAALVLEASGDEDQAIAGLLHDVAEDCGGEDRLAEIKERFGPRVEHIVRGCSDSLLAKGQEKAEYLKRKLAHIEHLRDSDDDILLVTAADKTHNARAIASDAQSIGAQIWERFNGTREQIIEYHNSIYEILKDGQVTPTLLNPLRSAIDIMESVQ